MTQPEPKIEHRQGTLYRGRIVEYTASTVCLGCGRRFSASARSRGEADQKAADAFRSHLPKEPQPTSGDAAEPQTATDERTIKW